MMSDLTSIPEHLVHYQKGCTAWLRTLLLDGKIKFSNPAHFNDPWDCRPNFVPIQNYEKKHIREARVELRRTRLKEAKTRDERRSAKNEIVTMKNLGNSIQPISDGLWNIIKSERRLYCLTPNPHNPLMWSHYADSHRGVCLKFHINNLFFGGSLPVHYHKEWPSLRIGTPKQELVEAIFLRKSDSWTYEHEYRIIAYEWPQPGTPVSLREASNYAHVVTQQEFAKIPNGSLREIILGCQMPREKQEEIAAMLHDSGCGVALKRAKIVDRRYELTTEDWV